MTTAASPGPDQPTVVVTGANGLVGSAVCAALVERGAAVRAVVRRDGAAPSLDGVEEHVGDFADPGFAADVVLGATAVVTTVHPMGSDLETQQRVAVEGTPVIARAAADAGVAWFVHLSTAGVYDRSPGVDAVDEHAALLGDDSHAYAVTKCRTDETLADLRDAGGLTRVLLRPPAILGEAGSSVWNRLHPEEIARDEPSARRNPEGTFAWVHVRDLAALAADLACERVPTAPDPDDGPVPGGCTPVNVAAPPAPWRAYHETVGRALDVPITWDDEPAWTGRIVADRAQRWGWTPEVDLDAALDELSRGLSPEGGR